MPAKNPRIPGHRRLNAADHRVAPPTPPARKEWTAFDTRKRATFLQALAEGHTVSTAARTAGVARTTAYEVRAVDREFAAAWDVALEDGVQVLEEEVFRRAVQGITREKGIYHQGVRIDTEAITEFSDVLLMFYLKAKRPDIYRERTEVKHTGQVNHAVAHIDVNALRTDELIDLERLARKALVEPAGDPEGAG